MSTRTPSAVIDYRSDIVAGMSPAIRSALVAALDDPPEFELRGDRHQAALERRAADLLGKEDALLFPTCTMANEAAIAIHCRPGDALIAERETHVITSETGGPGAVAGAVVVGVPGTAGLPDAEQVERWAAGARSVESPRPRALVLENTHLRSGGRPLALDGCHALRAICRARGVAVHLDGARLFNAAVATGASLSDLAACADTVAISLNKGLGAPIGALLAGSREAVDEALRIRHRLGGGFRPTGLLAAAGLAALENFDHIEHDHRRARALAGALAPLPGLVIDPGAVKTNIVLVDITAGPGVDGVVDALAGLGVAVLAFGPRRIRLVTHRRIDDAAVERTVEVFAEITSGWRHP